MEKEYKIELTCGHYAKGSRVEKEGTCCVWCNYCGKIVCISESHECAYSGHYPYSR
jgi:hypothetical protein